MVNIRDSLTLRACRIIADIKIEEMANAVGVTVDTFYKWEKNKSYPNAVQIVKIIDCFAEKGYKVNIDDIF